MKKTRSKSANKTYAASQHSSASPAVAFFAVGSMALISACGGGAGTKAAPATAQVEAPPASDTDTVALDGSTSDGLVVEGLGGTITRDQVHAGMAPVEPAFSNCFRVTSKKRPFVGGDVVLGITVVPSGAVSKVLLTESDLGDVELETCLLTTAKQARFSSPGAGDVTFEYPMAFPSKSTAPMVEWEPNEFEKMTVKRNRDHLSCRGKKKSAKATFYVGKRGKVKSVGFASDKDDLTKQWRTCAAESLLSWRFVDPKGRVAKITVPFKVLRRR